MKKQKNKQKTSPVKGPLEWIYIIHEDKSMRDLYELLCDNSDYKVEYWEAAGVIELTFEEAGGIDFEQSEDDDILWVTVSPKDYDGAMKAMKEIEKICGGEFALD